MAEEKSGLEILKEDYKLIQEKHNLPSFENLNKDFGIEKISEIETDYLIREIRKFAADKLSNYLRFIESILNPVNVPMIIFSIIKTLDQEDKKKLSDMYKKMAKMEVRLFEVDVQFSEEKEVEFVRDSYNIWQEVKRDALDVVEVIKKNWENKSELNGGRYFG